MVVVEITIKRNNGRYITYTKSFNDQRHMDNYMNVLYANEKVVGIKIK